MKATSFSIHGFILPNKTVCKDYGEMCMIAANYYEEFFFEPRNIHYPHPYTDRPDMEAAIFHEKILQVTTEKVLDVVLFKKKKKSVDAHALSNYMFNFLPSPYWSLITNIFNYSFRSAYFPALWKDTPILLLEKKEHICEPSATRPISLLDVFLKTIETLYQDRLKDLLNRHGLLPNSQPGFREGFRLQTRVLLFFDQVANLMANSSPVATIFVDFKAAFDQLWFEGCIVKLKSMVFQTTTCHGSTRGFLDAEPTYKLQVRNQDGSKYQRDVLKARFFPLRYLTRTTLIWVISWADASATFSPTT
ncbi:unnamed protein product [Adineta ricciae]|uniref:Reverse transcriptase domain-containing protein n=1 Tax=Adineta ricciae TaxID=249248 RepID=A0A814YRL1_ADIRI|nr:unnamed protein product [Adineta ricciae]CAF1232384.1 unnamed protein product [Adineta ricciae]